MGAFNSEDMIVAISEFTGWEYKRCNCGEWQLIDEVGSILLTLTDSTIDTNWKAFREQPTICQQAIYKLIGEYIC